MDRQQTRYRIHYEFDPETGQVMATVPALNHLSSFGETFAEAEMNIQEAVLAYLEVLLMEDGSPPPPDLEEEGTLLQIWLPTEPELEVA